MPITYKVQLPKILYLAFLISKHAKNAKYYNTNDLIKLANDMKPELVRTRKDKNDYKFLDDTNFGGLRGNFSTVLTLRGIVKRNNRFTTYYGIGKRDTLFNAFNKGKIILDTQDYIAYTNDLNLRNLLSFEANNLTIRETQAHIKVFLEKEKSKNIGIERDNINFPKVAVLKSNKNQYFLKILFNTFINDKVIEYNMLNYLSGSKIKTHNMHALFAVPFGDDAWKELYVIDGKMILKNTPLFIYFDRINKKFYDLKGNVYPFFKLDEALDVLSDQNGNIEERLNYDWNSVRNELVEDINVELNNVESDEFYVFLVNFLNWNKHFFIEGKEVVDINVSSSGGADVILTFSGGTQQKLELEHKWVNYINHEHYKSMAWSDTWLYADEKWDFNLIKSRFSPYIADYINCIPKIFLCIDSVTKEKEAYEVDWNTYSYRKLDIHS